MKKGIKTALKFLIVLLIVAIAISLACIGFIVYRIDYKKTEICTSASASGDYTLTVTQIGEPVFPYGSARCRFYLKSADKTVSELDFDVQNDGCMAHQEDFVFLWGDDCIKVTVSADEHDDVIYKLYFDGRITAINE